MKDGDAALQSKLRFARLAGEDDSLFSCVRRLEQTARQVAGAMQNSFGK